jgi:hypothetical protein
MWGTPLFCRKPDSPTPLQEIGICEPKFWAVVVAVWIILYSVPEVGSLQWINEIEPVLGLTPGRVSVVLGILSYWFLAISPWRR